MPYMPGKGFVSDVDIKRILKEEEKQKTWRDFFKTIPQFPQRQDSTIDQLKDLVKIANKFGFYDASDFLKDYLKTRGNYDYKFR